MTRARSNSMTPRSSQNARHPASSPALLKRAKRSLRSPRRQSTRGMAATA